SSSSGPPGDVRIVGLPGKRWRFEGFLIGWVAQVSGDRINKICRIHKISCKSCKSCNPVYYFFINSSTAEVIALTPVLNVGSGTGAKSAEWRPGNGTPDSRLCLTLAGSEAPS